MKHTPMKKARKLSGGVLAVLAAFAVLPAAASSEFVREKAGSIWQDGLFRRDYNGRVREFSRRGPSDLTDNPDGKVVDGRIDGAKEGEFERVAENRFVRSKRK